MAEFSLQPDIETKRYNYQATDEELELMASKNVINFSIDKDGVFCTYSQNNQFVEQSERYLTLLEALGNIPQ